MRAMTASNALGTRAKEALTAALHQVSTIELKGIEELKTPDLSRQTEFLAKVGVLGRDHTLACKVTPSGEMRAVRKALREFQEESARSSGEAIPVFIAPYLPPEARALCTENRTGFVDLEDNAWLDLGEVFISKRSLQRRERQMVSLPQAAETAAVRKFPPIRVAAPIEDWAVAAAVPA